MSGGGAANGANRVFTFEDVDKGPEESLRVSIPEVLSAVSHYLHNILIFMIEHQLNSLRAVS